ncbi:pimeloyl-ACP methyl ester carboxylesterase [Roseibium hamelinense]|uniref:Pimeloyl-ACP methyl ester carboxylesterase n=1 Tax=Roseibium hamelinense TaxID=150831 RepID=A0A562T7S8_9HYPH|nr:alpha/beta hydrolase [Roseibium hamelinense]MTI42973.1 alpha/beta hydrolase [Roseibium hamelinense]TWI89582.1 pimeloyl-ACP methyl ester carboxylesterase [Roseibium hamelinense]
MQHIVNDHILINGQRIAHGIHGTGEPVILLHGTPSSSLIWRDVVPRLTKAGYQVHVYDLLGFGLSERPRDPAVDTSVSAQGPVLEALMNHWGLESAHLIGHDLGGAIAKRLAIFRPALARSLTLIDIVSFDSWPSPRTRELMAAGLEKMITASDADHKAHFREWLLSAVQHKQPYTDGPLDTYLEFISGPTGQASLFQHQISHYDPKHTLEVADRLDELGALPVRILWGADDAWQYPEWAHKLHAAIPGSELTILEDGGHFLMEDQPDEVSRHLIDFLDRQTTRKNRAANA